MTWLSKMPSQRATAILRGALKALLIVNEHLEAELVELRAAMATGGTMASRTDQSLH
jgi:hypothetical protein